ncbi:MAG TPA: DsbE family thiol:disulfide interchange protein [Pseudomonadales bacterium]|nr:DsbE family thiol:disulfide interchange protein [Pseudomonadales bacterium]
MRFSAKQKGLAWLFIIPFILFLAVAVFLYKGLGNDPTQLPSTLVGQPMPAFSLAALDDPSHFITNKDVVGKPALINVWATWCPTCLAEHAELKKLADQGVRIVGVNYKDERETAQTFLANQGNPYQTVIFDEKGDLGLDLGVYGAPETFVVDAGGIIRYRLVGMVTEQEFNEKLKPLMEGAHE